MTSDTQDQAPMKRLAGLPQGSKSVHFSTPQSSRTWLRQSLDTSGAATPASERQPPALTDPQVTLDTSSSRTHFGEACMMLLALTPLLNRRWPSPSPTLASRTISTTWPANPVLRLKPWARLGWRKNLVALEALKMNLTVWCTTQLKTRPSTPKTTAWNRRETLPISLLWLQARSGKHQVIQCSHQPSCVAAQMTQDYCRRRLRMWMAYFPLRYRSSRKPSSRTVLSKTWL